MIIFFFKQAALVTYITLINAAAMDNCFINLVGHFFPQACNSISIQVPISGSGLFHDISLIDMTVNFVSGDPNDIKNGSS